MSVLKIMGQRALLNQYLGRWTREVDIREGHTVLEYHVGEPSAKTAKAVFDSLTTEYKFSAIDTSERGSEKRVRNFPDQEEAEVVLIPQIAGG